MGNTITEQILGAWEDEDPEEEGQAEETEGAEPDATTAEAEVQDEAPSAVLEDEEKTPDEEQEVLVVPDEEEVEEAPEEEEQEEPSGDEGEPTAASDDPEVQAFLDRHDGDTDAALRDGARLFRTVGRQGQELGSLRAHVQQLEAQLEQATLFQPQGGYLSEEQQTWVEEAAGSGQPMAYIENAVREGEFDLARAVLDAGEFTNTQTVRVMQAIDRAEQIATQPVEQEQPLAHNVLLEVLVENYPDMPQFESEMVGTMNLLGPSHPLVLLAHSNDPGEAAQGIIGIYEIARAKTATVASTRESVKTKSRQAADAARRGAVVSSAQATNSPEQSTRPRLVAPGLTAEDLEAAFDAE